MIGHMEVGKASVFIGDDHGEHSIDQLAEMMLVRLIHVSGTAPQPIQDQINAYRERARNLFIHYLREAQAIERRKILKHGDHASRL